MNIYYKIFKISLANQLEYRANFISGFLFSIVPFTVNVLLWLAVTAQSSTIPLEASGIVSYYFLTLITYNITSTTSVFKISDDIRLGSLNQYLIKPYNYTLYQLAVDLPYRFVARIFCIYVVRMEDCLFCSFFSYRVSYQLFN